MQHFCVWAHACTHTQFTSLERNTTIRAIFYHCLCSSYLDFKLGKRGRKMGGERVPPFSV